MQTLLATNSTEPASIREIRPITSLYVPLYSNRVSAGIPSPADDYEDEHIDFNDILIQDPSTTFCVEVNGDSMINAGIFSGDLLIVNKQQPVFNNCIVIARINGEITVKRFVKIANTVHLFPENENYDSIRVTEEMDFSILGVAQFAIHTLR